MAKTQTIESFPAIRHEVQSADRKSTCLAVVIWIDWYAYHVARFQVLLRNPTLAGRVAGLELVGGVGVHAGLKFREEIPSSMPVHTLLPDSNWSDAEKWRLALLLWRRLNVLNPEVVLVPGYYTLPALACAVWAKLNRKRSVLMTESTTHDHIRVWWREALKKALVNSLFDWAIAGGKPHREYLRRLGFPSARIASFYDVVDNSFFHDCCREIRRSHKSSDFSLPAKYFLYVGRIAAEKNIETLLKAYAQYRLTGGRWSLVLVGDGPLLNDARTEAAATPYASDIYFPGLKSTPELPPYYAFASAFVLASAIEPWGLVVNEAMASRLPVVVSQRCGCAEDLVNEGVNGFTFDPSDSEALTDTLRRLSELSPEERDEMGRQSSAIIAGFSPDAWADEVARIVSA